MAGRRALILPLLLVVFAFYLSFIGRTLRYDEAYTLRHFAVSPGIALLSYTEPNNHMLHSFLVWMMTALAGTSLIAVRFPAFAMAILSVALIYRLGAQLGGWRVGFAAAIFLSTNGAFADYAVNARGYTLAVFLTLALITLLYRPQRSRRMGYGLLLTCGGLILTLPTLAILIAGVVSWVLWQGRRSLTYRSALAPMILGGVMGAMFYMPSLLNGALGRSAGRFGYSDLGAPLAEWLSAIFGTPLIGYALALCCGLGVGVLLNRRDRTPLPLALTLIAVALAAALAQWVLIHSTFFGRNYLYLLPVICLIAAIGLAAALKKRTAAAACLLLVLAFFPLRTLLDQPTPVDAVLARFDTLLQPRDMLLVEQFADEPIFYHLQARNQWDRLLLTSDKRRLIVVTEPGGDPAVLIGVYGLGPYIGDCQPSTDPRWLPFAVYECPFIPATHS